VKKELLKYLVVALIAIGAGPAGAALWQWSLVPFTNSSVDPAVSWVNGMPTTSVEPSGRGMMAKLAEYRDDISGSLVTTGTASALAVTTKQSAGGTNTGLCGTGTVPLDGQLIGITPNVTNGASALLTVDGCTAAAIVTSPSIAAPAGTMIAGTPYTLKYSVAAGRWVLRDFYVDPYGVPLGGLMAYTAGSVPNSNFILPAGQCLSTTTFAAYWALMGSPGVGGCSAGQFAAVDLRGRVPAALDNMNGSAASRMTAAGCGVTFTSVGTVCSGSSGQGIESETLTLAQLPTGLTVANAAQSITVTGPIGHSIYGNGALSGVGTSGGSVNILSGGSYSTALTFSGSNSISVTSNNTSGGAHPAVQPSIAVSYLLRVI